MVKVKNIFNEYASLFELILEWDRKTWKGKDKGKGCFCLGGSMPSK